MCRSIKTLRGAEPPATDEEVRAAALQLVRKVSGYRAPSKVNAAVFESAVDEITGSLTRLLDGLAPALPPKPRPPRERYERPARAHAAGPAA